MSFEQCPCCGQLRPAVVLWSADQWRVTTPLGSSILKGWRQVQVFDLLWRKRNTQGLTIERMIDILCADDPDGGVSAGTMKGIIRLLRLQLEPLGIRIVAGTPSVRNGYVLNLASPPSLVPIEGANLVAEGASARG